MVVLQHRHFFYNDNEDSLDVIMLSCLVYNFIISSQYSYRFGRVICRVSLPGRLRLL